MGARRTPPTTDPRRAVVYAVGDARPLVAWCRAQGLEVVEVVEEPEPELPLHERVALATALAAVETRAAGVFATARREDLARTLVEYALALRLAERSGTTWRTVEEPAEVFDVALVEEVRRALVAHETLIYRPAIRAGRARRLLTGDHLGGAAAWGFEVIDGKLVENVREREVIAEMLVMRADGMSYPKLATWLAEQGLPGRGRPYAATVRRILAQAEEEKRVGKRAKQRRKP